MRLASPGLSGSPAAGTSSARSGQSLLVRARPPDFARDDARLDYFLATCRRGRLGSDGFRPEPARTNRRSTPCWNGTGTRSRSVMAGPAAVHPPRHRPVRLRPVCASRPRSPLCGLVFGQGEELRWGPDRGMAGGRAGCLCVFQQRQQQEMPCGTPPRSGTCSGTCLGPPEPPQPPAVSCPSPGAGPALWESGGMELA